MTIVVFGSINMDLVVRTARLPQAGETLLGEAFFTAAGGKGANQAVACARLGASTALIGRVGTDLFGPLLLAGLQAYGVDTSAVQTDPAQPSGVALITVDGQGENTIIGVSGANGLVAADDLARLAALLPQARLLLLQLEVPLPHVIAAARLAREHGVTVMLDPAPAVPLPPELYGLIDILTPNETEAATLIGAAVQTQPEVVRAAQVLHKRGAKHVVIKLGPKGVYWTDGATSRLTPSFMVKAVDTVAAGDAFNAGLAVALSEGLPITEALRWGVAAGALTVTKPGAQPALPERNAVLQLLG